MGFAVGGVEVGMVDANDQDVETGEVGEIAIRGHNVMKGYYKRPEATAEAMRHAWFHTGDIARRDEEGYLYIGDPATHIIIPGPFTLNPRDIADLINTHPALA